MANLDQQFKRTKLDWRETLRKNTHRTYWVIFVFVCLYALVGLLIDLFFLSNVTQAIDWGAGQQSIEKSAYFTDYLAEIGYQVKLLVTFQRIPYLTLIFLTFGLIAVFVSLMFHNRMMLLGTQYIEIQPGKFRNLQEETLWNVLEEMKIASGLTFIPKLCIIEANYMNAFASGWSQKSAMIVVTRGLLNNLNRSELQAVVAHELSHIKNMDVRLILMVAVLSNIMIIVIDIIFRSAIYAPRNTKSRRGAKGSYLLIIIIILRFILPMITMVLIFYLSRTRELMADSSCVAMMRDNSPLAKALLKISSDYKDNINSHKEALSRTAHESLRVYSYLFDPSELGLKSGSIQANLFSTHPSLQVRLAAIGFKRLNNQEEVK